ncbi:alpha/beta fold hydrolase [Pacificoceanicola onchidii]|uniref:alpha/beta fold hydrolase n=1 Tax=Pacificoceanicola onchidii TaxID=2562685 RepID=UPI0010A69E9C|nr:alpha/beta hydrolase [Pacificoceanicola onchidii]
MLKALLVLAGLAALLAAVTLVRAARHEAAALRDFPPVGDFIEVDGTRVHYVMRGAGPDLVLLHGSSGNLRDMTFQLMERLAQDYRVIAFDRPGLGYTDALDNPTITRQADLLAQAAEALGIEKPIVMGHSYGGAVALAWGVSRPEDVSALMLLAAPVYPWDTPLSTYYRVLSNPVLGPVAIPLITAFVPDRVVERNVAEVFVPQEEPDGYAAHFGPPLTLRRVSLRENAIQRARLLAEMTALSKDYDRLTMPIELLHGTADDTVSAAIHGIPFAQVHPTAEITLLDGIGHMPNHNRPGAVVEAIHRAAARAGLR